ncbi:hypothetical protein FBQ87_04160 [Sphingobacteriales bacterium CHB3]|nr:hypothetical protein [Sphingobacteriales bacterium CHB3]
MTFHPPSVWKIMKNFLLFGIIGVTTVLLSASAHAQLDQTGLLSATSVGTTTSNFYFAKPNELTIIVNVLGFVQKPGRYEISSTIDLINLLALAGGPSSDGTLKGVKISRLVRNEERFARQEFTIDLNDLTRVGAEQLALQPGDVVEVDRSTWSVVRDIFGVVGYAAVITTTAATVINLARR